MDCLYRAFYKDEDLADKFQVVVIDKQLIVFEIQHGYKWVDRPALMPTHPVVTATRCVVVVPNHAGTAFVVKITRQDNRAIKTVEELFEKMKTSVVKCDE